MCRKSSKAGQKPVQLSKDLLLKLRSKKKIAQPVGAGTGHLERLQIFPARSSWVLRHKSPEYEGHCAAVSSGGMRKDVLESSILKIF